MEFLIILAIVFLSASETVVSDKGSRCRETIQNQYAIAKAPQRLSFSGQSL